MAAHSVDEETINQVSSTGKKILLIVLRTAWLALAALLIALFIAGVGPRIRELSTVCTGDGCIPLAPSIADATFIQEAGFTLTQYAYIHLTLDIVFALAMLALAAVIFLGRFDDWFGIFVSFTILLIRPIFPGRGRQRLHQFAPGLADPLRIPELYHGRPLRVAALSLSGWSLHAPRDPLRSRAGIRHWHDRFPVVNYGRP